MKKPRKPASTKKPPVSYEVGYGRPPKEGQFPKGKSGNPKGRPKKKHTVIELVGKLIEMPVTIKVNGRQRKVTTREAILLRLINDALTGTRAARQDLLQLLAQVEPTPTPPHEQVSVEDIIAKLRGPGWSPGQGNAPDGGSE